MTVCPPVVSQYAAIAAFCDESVAELESHVRRYAVNRSLLLEALPELGFNDLAPADGAFYVYADIAHRTNDSQKWCTELLDATGVAVVPVLILIPHVEIKLSECLSPDRPKTSRLRSNGCAESEYRPRW